MAVVFFLLAPRPAFALQNNKFGIHIIQPEDLGKAAELVNSNEGDWGYVTIVIQEKDKNKDKWQKFFDDCRERHLIPLVRIATFLNSDIWEKPEEQSLSDWAEFLDDLNWPVKNRYIIVYNEPNHDKEWGGQGSPSEYAKILDKAETVFKQKNSDFNVLNAGFDQAAPNSATTIDELSFLQEMERNVPGIFSRLDGWVSHSYPNHGFIGKPWEKGKASVAGYEWELAVLKNSFSVNKDLPVFITETGWPHKIISNFIPSNGSSDLRSRQFKISNFYDEKLTAEYTKQAFEQVWLPDDKIRAVTPFILNYPYYPFENFSWMDASGSTYSQYEEIKSIKKNRGEPEQKLSYELIKPPFPPIITTDLVFWGKVFLKNTGQSIWGEKPFVFKAISSSPIKLTDLELPKGVIVEPGQIAELNFSLETPTIGGDYSIGWEGLSPYKIKVFGAWGLTSSKNAPINSLLESIFSLLSSF